MTRRAHWVLQENHPAPSSLHAVREAVERIGRTWQSVRLRGYVDEIPPLAPVPDGVPLVCHGPSFVPRALGHPRLARGLWFSRERFRWSAFRSGWGERMLCPDARVVAASDAIGGGGGDVFARPDEDSKAFDGGVFGRRGLAETLAEAVGSGRMGAADGVVLGDPMRIDAEWRLFVVGGEVVAASSYRWLGRPSTEGPVPVRAVDLAYEAIGRWRPADAFCLDVGESGGRLGIVEANCVNAARLYAADPAAIVLSLSELAEGAPGG